MFKEILIKCQLVNYASNVCIDGKRVIALIKILCYIFQPCVLSRMFWCKNTINSERSSLGYISPRTNL